MGRKPARPVQSTLFALAEGLYAQEEEFWARGHSRGWYLLQTALLHPYGHWFEAFATRGQLGLRGR